MRRDLPPISAIVSAHEDRAVPRAKVETRLLGIVRSHRIAQDRGKESIRQARFGRCPGLTYIVGAPDARLALRREAIDVRRQRKDEYRLRLTRMNHDRKSEVARQPIGDRSPLVARIVGAVDPAVVLGEYPVRRFRM